MQYVWHEEIGRGAWSTVYKGRDRLSDQVVAIKKLVPEAGVPRREVALARQITHRNVCRIHNVFQAPDGSYCIVMEYVDGGSLRNLIEKSAPLTLERGLAIAIEILDGLAAAHQKISGHYDLKPENILLTSNGTVKITDFGHAREIGKQPSQQSAQAVGTPGYWSPEQAMGKDIDARTDIYAFGKILSELFSRRDVPPYVTAVIKRCTELDRTQRFASAAEVREALRARGLEPVPRLTGLLATCVLILIVVSIPVWKKFSPGLNGFHGFQSVQSVKSAASPKQIQRLAVIDFQNLTSDKSLDPYTVGIGETLGTELGRLRALRLVARDGAETIAE